VYSPFRFNLCRTAVKSSFVNLDSRSNEEVKTVTKLVCEVSNSGYTRGIVAKLAIATGHDICIIQKFRNVLSLSI
jgi:hypothetical protein